MATLPDCNHAFCRDCLIAHVRAKMSEAIFPIYCPLCAVDDDGRGRAKTGAYGSYMCLVLTADEYCWLEIDQRTLKHLSDVLDSDEYEKFEVLQLRPHAMALSCPEYVPRLLASACCILLCEPNLTPC